MNDKQPNADSVFGTSHRCGTNAAPVGGRARCKRPSRPIPVAQTPEPCLFLERFPMEEKGTAISRFFTSAPVNVLTLQPEELVRRTRGGLMNAMCEINGLSTDKQFQMSLLYRCLSDMYDRIEKYPDEAEAFARFVVETLWYRQICSEPGGPRK